MSVTVFDNNPDKRMYMDNLVLIKFYDKFFDTDGAPRSDMSLDDSIIFNNCTRFIHYSNYTLCGEIIPREFETPDLPATMTENEKEDAIYEARLRWERVDFKKIKLFSLIEDPPIPFEHAADRLEDGIDYRIVYIADMGNHCIRRILIR